MNLTTSILIFIAVVSLISYLLVTHVSNNSLLFKGSLIIGACAGVGLLYFTSDYYSKSHTQLLAGVLETIVALAVLLAVVVFWVIYFIYTREFVRLLVPVLILLVTVIPSIYSDIRSTIADHQYSNQKEAWLSRVQNMHFLSEKNKVSFDYISESFTGGSITVEESSDTILLHRADGGFTEAIKVFEKDPKVGLLKYLQNKYSEKYPLCVFFKSMIDGFPSNFVIIKLSTTGVDEVKDCPSFGIEPDGDNYLDALFLMDESTPGRYAYVSTSLDSLEAYRPVDPSVGTVGWYKTIMFQK